MNTIERKRGHIDSALQQQSHTNCFDSIRLRHCALPNVNLDQVTLTTKFFDKITNAPFFVSSMTGGPAESEKINRHLAEACCELGIAMGVGSQKISLEQDGTAGLSRSIRHAIGNQPLFANFGAVNLANLKHVSELSRILDPIEADALILHLNPMQEVFQKSGDTDWSGVLDHIARVCEWSPVPVVVKEVGFGLDLQSSGLLVGAGVHVLDVAGMGGTRFADIEIGLNPEIQQKISSDRVFDDWGYTTVESLCNIKRGLPSSTCWASGGVRHGLDVAKCLCLGAMAVGIAGRFLRPATESTDAVIGVMRQFMSELRISCFGVGVRSTQDLNDTYILGRANGN